MRAISKRSCSSLMDRKTLYKMRIIAECDGISLHEEFSHLVRRLIAKYEFEHGVIEVQKAEETAR